MRYVSTRGEAPALGFEDVLLAGLASDGGLYLPERWPRIDAAAQEAWADLDYPALAARIMAPFIGPAVERDTLERLAWETYAGFHHPAVAPLKQLEERLWLMELFHGPTLAFKDFAMQLLGRLFDLVLERRGRRITIVGATSGDTGSAAIEACHGRERVEVFILYPQGRVSPVQRRQMTTVEAPNVHAIAIEGDFDTCQDLVKAMFADRAFREEVSLAAVNSINWARIMAQVVYYARAALLLGRPGRPIDMSVPTGNFGNVFAGYVARQMGLPIGRLVLGSNANDILPRFFESGEMLRQGATATLSPSMDIQVSSNFERLLFEALDRDGAAVSDLMTRFRASGRFELPAEVAARLGEGFAALRSSDAETLEEIARTRAASGEILDPHTAIGVRTARHFRAEEGTPMVALATAHPAKFPDAVERAIGVRPALPTHLADLLDRDERLNVLPADLAAIEAEIRRARVVAGAA